MNLWNKLVNSLGTYEEPESVKEEGPSLDPYQEAADILEVDKAFLIKRLSNEPVSKPEAGKILGISPQSVGIARQIQFSSSEAWAKRHLGISDAEMDLIEKMRKGGNEALLKELVKEPKSLVDFLSYCYSYINENEKGAADDAKYHLEQARLELVDLISANRSRTPKQLLNSYAEIILRVYYSFLKTFKNG